MANAQKGDGTAYREVLEASRKIVIRYFARSIDSASAEDLAQETLLSIHNKRHTYDPDFPFLPWLFAIARYRLIDLLRSRGRHETLSLEDFMEELLSENSPSDRIDVEKLLALLSPAQADAIRLVKLDGASTEEAADKLATTISSVKVLVHRGMKKLTEIVRVKALI